MQASFPRAKSWVTSWEAFGLQRRCDGHGLSLWSLTPMAALTWSASDLGFSCGFRMWHRLLFFLWVIHLKLFSGLFLLLIANSVKAQSIVHFSLHFHPKPCAKHTFKAHLLIVWLIDLGFSHLTQFYHRAAAAFFFFKLFCFWFKCLLYLYHGDSHPLFPLAWHCQIYLTSSIFRLWATWVTWLP